MKLLAKKIKTRRLVSIFLVVVIAVVVCILIVHKSEDKSQNGEGDVTMFDVDVVNTTTEEHIDFTTDDWTSFEFFLNNKVYAWPVTYSELTADGYVIKYDEVKNVDEQRKYEECIHMCIAYNERRPSSSAANYIMLSNCYKRLQKTSKALKALRKADEINKSRNFIKDLTSEIEALENQTEYKKEQRLALTPKKK